MIAMPDAHASPFATSYRAAKAFTRQSSRVQEDGGDQMPTSATAEASGQ